jgi:hypothetical protein
VHQQTALAVGLADGKAGLERQLSGVLAAERELTRELRETHAAIEGQLVALREQLQVRGPRGGRRGLGRERLQACAWAESHRRARVGSGGQWRGVETCLACWL